VLSGDEIAALAVLDACVRLIPGVMGKEESGADESFESGLLEYPHFTRPCEWESRAIPDVLLSGDHAKIAASRRAEAERIGLDGALAVPEFSEVVLLFAPITRQRVGGHKKRFCGRLECRRG
jgi:hypothetical protein